MKPLDSHQNLNKSSTGGCLYCSCLCVCDGCSCYRPELDYDRVFTMQEGIGWRGELAQFIMRQAI